jgi:glycosyltransferase involved in cell wall biosynthesis
VNPLRIVHLDSGRTWRGGQRQALLLALGLRDRGHESFLIAAPDSPLAARARASGLAVATSPMRADWDLRAAKKIRSRIRAWRANVVHAHDARSHALAMLALLGRRTVPLIVTRRVPFTPRSARLKYGDRIAHFIAISNAVKHAMVLGGIDARRITVVHSGIPLARDPVVARDWRREAGWPQESVVCGMSGAMTSEKGLGLLDLISRALPDDAAQRARLLLLGGTATGVSTIGGVTAFSAGFVDPVEPAMAGLDVLLHPSTAEGLGTAVLDAMAAGVPPVAFASGGLPEVIEHGKSGLLAPGGDPRLFAAEAAKLILDPSLRAKLGAGAKKRVEAFSALAMTKGTEAVYEGVITR